MRASPAHNFTKMAKPKTRPTRREPTYAAVAKPVAVEAPPAAPAPAPTPVVDLRGRNVSGRPWKQPPKSRSSSLKMTQPRKSWDAKKREREARQRASEKEAELVEARKERIAEQKRKTEEKRSRKRRNEFRNAQYQVITNDKTVKSLSKKNCAKSSGRASRPTARWSWWTPTRPCTVRGRSACGGRSELFSWRPPGRRRGDGVGAAVEQ